MQWDYKLDLKKNINNKCSWYRLITDMKNATITQQPMPSNAFKVIRDCLEKFEAIITIMLNKKKALLNA